MSAAIAIGLVACAKTKRAGELAAAEKYSSPLFKKSLAAARAECAEVFILSAKHGLLPLDALVDDYNQSLAETPTHLRTIWAANVGRELADRFGGKQIDFRIWGGSLYVAGVRASMRGQQWSVSEPLKGLGVGDRLHALSVAGGSRESQLETALRDLIAAINSVEIFDDKGAVETSVQRASLLVGVAR